MSKVALGGKRLLRQNGLLRAACGFFEKPSRGAAIRLRCHLHVELEGFFGKLREKDRFIRCGPNCCLYLGMSTT